MDPFDRNALPDGRRSTQEAPFLTSETWTFLRSHWDKGPYSTRGPSYLSAGEVVLGRAFPTSRQVSAHGQNCQVHLFLYTSLCLKHWCCKLHPIIPITVHTIISLFSIHRKETSGQTILTRHREHKYLSWMCNEYHIIYMTSVWAVSVCHALLSNTD